MAILWDWETLDEEKGGNGVSRRRLDGAGASLVRVAIDAGVKAGRHSHDHEQFVQVLSGAGVLHTAEGSRPFRAGSIFHFAPHTWHAADFDEATVLVETNLGS